MPGRALIPRILITLLGIAFLLTGMSEIVLGLVGEKAEAVVTDIRREGGERTDGKPGRYTYNIGYLFTLPDGRVINGVTRKISGAVYVKADGTSAVKIRYLHAFPYINTMESNTGPGAGQLILILAGGALVLLINLKKSQAGTD